MNPLDPIQLERGVDGTVRYRRPSWCAPCAPCDCLCADPVGASPSTQHVLLGSLPNQSPENAPQFRATLTTPYWFGRHELTVRCIALCQIAGACDQYRLDEYGETQRQLPQRADYAASHLLRRDAENACRFFGGLLPTQAQWVLAARGTDGRYFPWGNDAICDGGDYATIGPNGGPRNIVCVPGFEARAQVPVGSFPRGAGPFGTMDLLGGVAEWMRDYAVGVPWHQSMLRMNEQGIEPVDPTGPLSPDANTPEMYRNGVLRSPTTNVSGIGSPEPVPFADIRDGHIGARCVWRSAPGG